MTHPTDEPQIDQFSPDAVEDTAARAVLARLKVRFAPQGGHPDLEVINEAEGRTRSERLLPVDEAIASINRIKNPSDGRIRSWTDHPDERVAVAVAERAVRERFRRWSKKVALPTVTYRALAEVEAGPERWTPLLDAVAASDRVWREGYRAIPRPDWLPDKAADLEERFGPVPQHATLESTAQAVARHLEDEDEEALDALMETRSSTFLLQVFPAVRGSIAPDRVQRLLDRHNALFRPLLKSAQTCDAALEWALQRPSPYTQRPHTGARQLHVFYPHPEIPNRFFEAALDRLKGASEDLAHSLRRFLVENRDGLAAGQLIRLIGAVPWSRDMNELAGARHADERVWCALLDATSSPLVREWIATGRTGKRFTAEDVPARAERAWADPQIGEALRASRTTEVLLHRLTSREEDARAVIPLLFGAGSDQAVGAALDAIRDRPELIEAVERQSVIEALGDPSLSNDLRPRLMSLMGALGGRSGPTR